MSNKLTFLSLFLGMLVAETAFANGFVFVHSNAVKNYIIVYKKNDDGTLTKVTNVDTGGKGTGEGRPLHGGKPGPDPLVSTDSLILSRDGSRMFVVNAGENSVSVFKVDENGVPVLLDREATGSRVPNSLAYNEERRTLYAGHLFGPEHIKVMDLSGDDLVLRDGGSSVDTAAISGRILSDVELSPKQDYLIGTVLLDPKAEGKGFKATESDGLGIFKIDDDGNPGSAAFAEAGGREPFTSVFLGPDSNRFLTVFAEDNGAAINDLGADGSVKRLSFAEVESKGSEHLPLEYCWVAFSPDKKFAYVSSFGLGNLASFKIEGDEISVARQDIGFVPATSDFTAGAKVPTSAAVDVWSSEDGYLYQLYGAAGKLGAFRMTEDGGLDQIALYDVPVNSVQGITGFVSRP